MELIAYGPHALRKSGEGRHEKRKKRRSRGKVRQERRRSETVVGL